MQINQDPNGKFYSLYHDFPFYNVLNVITYVNLIILLFTIFFTIINPIRKSIEIKHERSTTFKQIRQELIRKKHLMLNR